MYEPIPLSGLPVPPPHWLAHLSAPLAGDALADLLATAAELLGWINDEDIEPVLAIVEVAHELVIAMALVDEDRPTVDFPTELATQAAGQITDGSDLIETHRSYDVCADEYDVTVLFQVAEMRHTAQLLLEAARDA